MTQETYDAIRAIQNDIRGVSAYHGLRTLRRYIKALERQLAEKNCEPVPVEEKEVY